MNTIKCLNRTPAQAVSALTDRDLHRLMEAKGGRVLNGSTGLSSKGITERGSVVLTVFGIACLDHALRAASSCSEL